MEVSFTSMRDSDCAHDAGRFSAGETKLDGRFFSMCLDLERP